MNPKIIKTTQNQVYGPAWVWYPQESLKTVSGPAQIFDPKKSTGSGPKAIIPSLKKIDHSYIEICHCLDLHSDGVIYETHIS